MTRILALDVGDRRVGAAVSDASGLIASPLSVIRRRSKAEDFGQIARLAREQGAVRLVVGLPLDSEGRQGAQARRIERYATALAQALAAEGLDLPIEFWDESLSTRQAQAVMIQSGRRRKDRRARLDAVAAASILQDYLEARSRSDLPGEQDADPGVAPSQPADLDVSASEDMEEAL